MTIEQPLKSGANGVYRFRAPAPNDLGNSTDLELVRIDTHNVRDKLGFLKSTAAALSFPDYFGQNWDAFYDCLTDRADPVTVGLVMVFDDLSGFARTEPEEFAAGIDAMVDAAEYWKEQGKTLVALIGLDESLLAPDLPEITLR